MEPVAISLSLLETISRQFASNVPAREESPAGGVHVLNIAEYLLSHSKLPSPAKDSGPTDPSIKEEPQKCVDATSESESREETQTPIIDAILNLLEVISKVEPSSVQPKPRTKEQLVDLVLAKIEEEGGDPRVVLITIDPMFKHWFDLVWELTKGVISPSVKQCVQKILMEQDDKTLEKVANKIGIPSPHTPAVNTMEETLALGASSFMKNTSCSRETIGMIAVMLRNAKHK